MSNTVTNDELTKAELKELKEILDRFEWQEYCRTGMRYINGGYATADMFNYDDEYIDIELKWGEQDMGSGDSYEHKEQYRLKRSVLNEKKSIEEKIKEIED